MSKVSLKLPGSQEPTVLIASKPGIEGMIELAANLNSRLTELIQSVGNEEQEVDYDEEDEGESSQ